jgi:NAD(P)-dependent dehydrogenase (short-subunit alcohol dehydrogenase family)
MFHRDTRTSSSMRLNLFVTGASRGLGRAITIAVCEHYQGLHRSAMYGCVSPTNSDTTSPNVAATTTTVDTSRNAATQSNSKSNRNRNVEASIDDTSTTSKRSIKENNHNVHVILVARSKEGLQSVTQEILDHVVRVNDDNLQADNQNHKNHTAVYHHQEICCDHNKKSTMNMDNDDEKSTVDSTTVEETTTTTTTTTTKTTSTTNRMTTHWIISQIAADLGNIHTIDSILNSILQCWEHIPPSSFESESPLIRLDNSSKNQEVSPPLYYDTISNEVKGKGRDEEKEQFIFINNVGSLGPIGMIANGKDVIPPSIIELNSAITVNVTNAIYTTQRIVQWFVQSQSPEHKEQQQVQRHLTIVNISSLVAVQAFPSLAIYSTGKAARDSYHQALAKELQASTTTTTTCNDENTTNNLANIRILNYAPGPLHTDMTTELQHNVGALHPSIQEYYDPNNVNSQSNLIDPMDSARVLCQILQDDNYENGAHIDYYDYCRRTIS